jgi:hypothetical protein
MNAHHPRYSRTCGLRAYCLDGECVMIIILGLILIAAVGLFGHRPVHQQASAGH